MPPGIGQNSRLLVLLTTSFLFYGVAFGYPEFQRFSQENSGRFVDCAMCHTHPDGPEGPRSGQIGSLSEEELVRLNQARAAAEPGQSVDSPILNEFGNHIVEVIGRRQFVLLRSHPSRLASMLGYESDLDGDGISDAQEYLDGTHPLDPRHGDPMVLFLENLRRHWFHLFMIVLATMAGLLGLNNFLKWFEIRSETRPEELRVSADKSIVEGSIRHRSSGDL